MQQKNSNIWIIYVKLTFILSTFSASSNLRLHSTNSTIESVFPQFHEIQENEKFGGKGFTEWTFLKPLTRIVNSILIRKPHHDIEFYNLLDYDHRAYMRIMADYFGIYGFCYYHFWFNDHPVMHKPVEAIIRDGEPNKPFFFCWANEPWTRRWDGSKNDVLLAQDYGDNDGNILHFKYLLTFFQHANYIHVDGKPMFAFYRIEKSNIIEIDNIMKLWSTLALDNAKGSGSLIFPNGKFDEKIYLENNPNVVANNVNGTLHYNSIPPAERRFRESQCKVFSIETTWHVIERRTFENQGKTYRGTALYWNNAPRRNFTNGKYQSYPHMMDQMVMMVIYDALMAVKSIAKRSNGKTIIHIGHNGGDTEKYIKDLIMLFDHYKHIYNPLTHIPNPNENCILLHIHSAMVGKGAP
eukprot:gene9491-19724_t